MWIVSWFEEYYVAQLPSIPTWEYTIWIFCTRIYLSDIRKFEFGSEGEFTLARLRMVSNCCDPVFASRCQGFRHHCTACDNYLVNKFLLRARFTFWATRGAQVHLYMLRGIDLCDDKSIIDFFLKIGAPKITWTTNSSFLNVYMCVCCLEM